MTVDERIAAAQERTAAAWERIATAVEYALSQEPQSQPRGCADGHHPEDGLTRLNGGGFMCGACGEKVGATLTRTV